MADAEALDPSRWNVGTVITGSGKVVPANLLSTLHVGVSAMHWRSRRKLVWSELSIEPDRFSLLRALVDTINSWRLAPSTAGSYARSLKRFVKWVDGDNGTLSRATIVQLLTNYRGDAAENIDVIKRAVAQIPDLTAAERDSLFPPASPTELEEDDWAFTLDTNRGRLAADFLRLIVPGHAALPPSGFRRVRENVHMHTANDHSGRAELVRALRDEFMGCVTSRSYTPFSLQGIFVALRQFVVWADERGLMLDRGAAMEAWAAYSTHLTLQWRAGRFSDSTVRFKVLHPLSVLSGALARQSFEIYDRLSLPSSTDSGWTSARPNQAELQRFCSNLHAIILALPSHTLCAPIQAPLQIELLSESESLTHHMPEPHGGYGEQGFDSRIANLPLITLRIWAEMHRFIAITGCNLAVAQSLTIGDWRANGLRMMALKERANKYVSVRASRLYEKHLEGHVEFLEAALPLSIEDETPLFAWVHFSRRFRTKRNLVACLRAKTTKPIVSILDPARVPGVHLWVKANGLRLTTRQLRRAKSSWLLRRYSGDSLRVAQALGNTPGVVHGHYGGKGNLEQAIPEWSRHWASTQAEAALAPGKCESPGRYEPINGQGSTPGTCNEGGCLSCWHYRGEESLDYIHSMLSYRYCLCFRASSNSEAARQIEVIDQILEAYLEKNADHREAVHKLRSQLSDHPHPRFAAMIRLLEFEHAL